MSALSHRRRLWTKRTAQLAACGLLAGSASLAVASTAVAAAAATVTICHSTGSNNNPYVTNHPAADGDVGGHDGHTGPIWSPGAATWGDIIPSFTYIDNNGVQQTYPGRNNTGFGAQILANNCNIPPVALDIDKKGTQSGHPGDTVTYTLTVENQHGPTSGTLTVTDNLPTGLDPGTMVLTSGPGTWTCPNNDAAHKSQNPSCSTTDSLPFGAAADVFTVTTTISANAKAGTLHNTATVAWTGGSDSSSADTVVSLAAKAPAISVSKTGDATATVGDTVHYTVTASMSAAGGPATGTTTVSDTLPAAFSGGSMAYTSGTGSAGATTAADWTCSGLSCHTIVGVLLQPSDSVVFTVTATAGGLGKQTDSATASSPGTTDTKTFDTTVSAAAVVNNLTLVPACTVGTPGQITWTIGNPAGNPSVNTLAVTNGPALPPTTLAQNTTTTFTTAAPQATALTATGKTTPGNQNVSSTAVSFNNSCTTPPVNPGETPATVALTNTCAGFHAVFTTASLHATQFTVSKPTGGTDTVNGSDNRDYAADASNSHISVAFDGQNTSADWVQPAGCPTPTPTPTPTPPAGGQADPGVTAANHCKTGINLVLSNMNGTAGTVFVVTAPDGSTQTVPVGAGQIKKVAFAVAEDTTGVATARAPGLAKQTFTYDKNCASVLGIKHVRKPQQPKPTKVEGEKSTLPFTGFNAQRALMDGAALLFVGALLCGMASRRRGRFEA